MTTLADETFTLKASPDLPPALLAERRDSSGQIFDMLDRLPANQQETIRLKFQNGLSYREISEVTGLSVSHVGVLIHNGLKSLKQGLGSGEFTRVRVGVGRPESTDPEVVSRWVLGRFDEDPSTLIEAAVDALQERLTLE